MDVIKRIKKADYFIWIGNDGLYIWDQKKKAKTSVKYLNRGRRVPYMQGFSDIWEDQEHYKKALGEVFGKNILHKFGILLAVPEDISLMEKRAVEDFIYLAAAGRLRRNELMLFSQGMVVHNPKEDFVAVTSSSRCYCITLTRNGGIEDKVLAVVFSM